MACSRNLMKHSTVFGWILHFRTLCKIEIDKLVQHLKMIFMENVISVTTAQTKEWKENILWKKKHKDFSLLLLTKFNRICNIKPIVKALKITHMLIFNSQHLRKKKYEFFQLFFSKKGKRKPDLSFLPFLCA